MSADLHEPASESLQTMEADFTETIVPASHRRSNFRMLATFMSMQVVFGAVLVGYGARFGGLTLGELVVAMAIAATVMTVYCIGSANVGAYVGQTHAVTTRSIFGTIGSLVVSALLILDGMGFYLFTVLFIVTIMTALLGTLPAIELITATLAFVMIVNNYFGFTGLQRFAQYVAVPVIIVWGVYATIRAFLSVSPDTLAAVPASDNPSSILLTATAMVGLSTWGNEPDIFRYSRAGRASWWNIPTIAISYFLGAFIFPIMGYYVAALASNPDQSSAIAYFVDFSAFGLAPLLLIVLVVNQWAIQDGNLYIAINGAQNILSRISGFRRQYTVIGLGALAAAMTFILPNLQQTFTIVTGIGATTVPVASTIMAVDLFLVPRLFGLRRPMRRIPSWRELAVANWPAVVALVIGSFVGLFTAGLIPFLGTDVIGFPPIQAWLTGAVVYLVEVALIARNPRAGELLGYVRGDGDDSIAEQPAATPA
jgi:purine-cytosine permease-like protein